MASATLGLDRAEGTKRAALPLEMQDTVVLPSQTAAIVTFMDRQNHTRALIGEKHWSILLSHH